MNCGLRERSAKVSYIGAIRESEYEIPSWDHWTVTWLACCLQSWFEGCRRSMIPYRPRSQNIGRHDEHTSTQLRL